MKINNQEKYQELNRIGFPLLVAMIIELIELMSICLQNIQTRLYLMTMMKSHWHSKTKEPKLYLRLQIWRELYLFRICIYDDFLCPSWI